MPFDQGKHLKVGLVIAKGVLDGHGDLVPGDDEDHLEDGHDRKEVGEKVVLFKSAGHHKTAIPVDTNSDTL